MTKRNLISFQIDQLNNEITLLQMRLLEVSKDKNNRLMNKYKKMIKNSKTRLRNLKECEVLPDHILERIEIK